MDTIHTMMILGNAANDWTLGWMLFVVVALILVFTLLKWGKPREQPSVVISNPPVRNPNDPVYIRHRAQAAAAAVVMHRKRHANGELDEER
jgi:hypothetical protein